MLHRITINVSIAVTIIINKPVLTCSSNQESGFPETYMCMNVYDYFQSKYTYPGFTLLPVTDKILCVFNCNTGSSVMMDVKAETKTTITLPWNELSYAPKGSAFQSYASFMQPSEYEVIQLTPKTYVFYKMGDKLLMYLDYSSSTLLHCKFERLLANVKLGRVDHELMDAQLLVKFDNRDVYSTILSPRLKKLTNIYKLDLIDENYVDYKDDDNMKSKLYDDISLISQFRHDIVKPPEYISFLDSLHAETTSAIVMSSPNHYSLFSFDVFSPKQPVATVYGHNRNFDDEHENSILRTTTTYCVSHHSPTDPNQLIHGMQRQNKEQQEMNESNEELKPVHTCHLYLEVLNFERNTLRNIPVSTTDVTPDTDGDLVIPTIIGIHTLLDLTIVADTTGRVTVLQLNLDKLNIAAKDWLKLVQNPSDNSESNRKQLMNLLDRENQRQEQAQFEGGNNVDHDGEGGDVEGGSGGAEGMDGGAQGGQGGGGSGGEGSGGSGGSGSGGSGKGKGKDGMKKGIENKSSSKPPSDDISEYVPKQVEAANEELRLIALNKRLKDIEMTPFDAKFYDSYSKAVSKQTKQLRVILEAVKAKEKERIWIKNQATGDLDETKIVDGLTGEHAIYKRRGDKTDDWAMFQKKPKKLKFLFDVSASMFRFDGYDHRLERSLETAVMLMESLGSVGLEHKFKYEIIGHSGSSHSVLFVNSENPPKTNKDRLNIIQQMRAHAQYCSSGDSTLEGMAKAIKDVIKDEDGDDYFVFTLSDANIKRYGITHRAIRKVLNLDSRVNVYLIFIGSMNHEAHAFVDRLPAGKSFLCLDTGNIPKVIHFLICIAFTSIIKFLNEIGISTNIHFSYDETELNIEVRN